MRKAFGMTILAFAIFGAGYLLGAQSAPTSAQTELAELDELFAPFWETWDLLHQSYVDPVDDTTLMEGGLRGMLEVLGDPNTGYMTPREYRMATEDLEGSFEGIGTHVRQDEESGALVIVSVIPASPAEAAGVLAGDAVHEVDGERITALNQMQIVNRIRGPAGSTVRLGIRRPGVPGLMQIEVTRAHIDIPSVESRMIGDVAYLQVQQFGARTVSDVRAALAELQAQQPTGLILDLRGNPGGYLQTVVDVASELLPEGPVLIERSANGETTHLAAPEGMAETIPMVVLVNEGSASASELLAGAIQDRGRAPIVGTVTFGKGTVQTWHELSNGGGVRITISRWYTPDGRAVDRSGLAPDVLVEWPINAVSADFDPQLEAALRVLGGHSVWPTWPLPLSVDHFLVLP
jgi:carboxyl-terminal processing protease